jgi:hypothetical protein
MREALRFGSAEQLGSGVYMGSAGGVDVDDDEDTQKQPTRSDKLRPLDTFHGQLLEFQSACQLLAHALRWHDSASVEFSAQEAVVSCLGAKAALRRLTVQATPTDLHVRLARLILQGAEGVLGTLLDQAEAQIDRPSLRSLLHELRLSLVLASDERPHNDTGGH